MNTLKSVLLLLSLFFLPIVYAQNWGASTFSQFTNEANDVELNANEEAYIAGYLTGETAFNSTNVVPSAAGNGDIFIAKYSPSGTLIWKKTFGGSYSDRAIDLAIGADQNIVVTGQFFGTVNFGSTTLTSVGNSKDIFIIKLDPQGNVLWARSEGGNMAENAYGITVDNLNNVILTGQFQGTASIGNSSFTSQIDPNTNQYSFDFFISKYDDNGNPVWSLNGSAQYEDRGLAVTTDNQNNIFFTGQFSKTLSFASNTYPNQGYNIGFLCKLSPAGQVQFFNQMKAGMTIPYDLELNSNNQVFVTGDFIGNMNYYDSNGAHAFQNPYEKQIFIIKTENNGNYMWNYSLGSNNDISARAITVDLHNDAFVTGSFKCDLSQIQDTAQATFNSVGFKDPYLLKITNTGQFEYIKHFGGKKDDEGLGIAIKENDKPFICGSFTKDLNFAYSGPSVQTDNNNFSLHTNVNETAHHYFIGDDTRNSFLINHVNTNYPTLNYYVPTTTDSLVGNIVPYFPTPNFINDTLHFCTKDSLRYDPLTYSHYGPAYNYLWNNGTTANKLIITSTGDYSVTTTRIDECEFDVDTIHAISEPIPTLPLLSDDDSINVFHPGSVYNPYHYCYPDSVDISYSNLDTTASLVTNCPNGAVLPGAGPFTIQNEGWYFTVVENEYCVRTGKFHFSFDYVLPNDSVSPQIAMNNANLTGDSITICANQQVHFSGIDLITNPQATYLPDIQSPVTNVIWTINGGQYNNYQNVRTYFTPGSSGWYTVDLYFSTGYINLCGVDTTQYHVTRQFYITVNPLPTWSGSISGSNLLCPNGSVFLTVNNPHENFNWSGPGIIWNNLNDSIEVNAAGTYHYSGSMIDTVNGCSTPYDVSYLITLKTAPDISSDPADAIVCPYDSVLMFIQNTYQSYEWIGPNGDSLSQTYECYGEDLGFYYCHVVDNEDCHLTTPPFELREYTTPSITIMPDEFLCSGESVTIQVAYAGTPSFVWHPNNSTGSSITVNTPGIYSVEITQCGITISDSVEIIDGTFSASINAADTSLCFGDTVLILGTPSNLMYEWNDGQLTGGTNPVYEAGTYSAIVTNEYGCTAQTNSIVITQVAGSEIPMITSPEICPGSSVTLTNTQPYSLNWYTSSDSTFLFTGNSMNLSNVLADTSFLVAFETAECAPAYGVVTVEIMDSLPDFSITGDSLLCLNENGLFSINTTTETITWYSGVNSIGSANPMTISFQTLQNNPVFSVQVSNDCFTTSITDSVEILPQTQIDLINDSISLCFYDTEIISLNNNNLDSVVWNSLQGTVSDDELTVSGDDSYGTISVFGYDENGCVTNTETIEVITPNFNSTISVDFSNFCTGDSGTISVQTNADSLVWTTPFGIVDTTSISFTIDEVHSGMFYLEQWDNLGCHYTDSVFVPEYLIPNIDLLPDSIYCVNDIYTFYFPNDTNTYVWSTFGNSTNIPILDDQDLVLNVTTPQGCVAFDTLFVETVDCEDAIPNFITANGDGTNDYFFIDDALSQRHNDLIIFNRYGNKVYEVNGYANEFDGGNLHPGVYFYVYYPNGKDEPGNYRQGFITLIR